VPGGAVGVTTKERSGIVKVGDETYFTKKHNHDEGFDRVQIYLEPRWKESELSGDEYRWSHYAHAYRKGEVIAKGGGLTLLEAAIDLIPKLYVLSVQDLLTGDECAQPECPNEPDVLYRLITQWNRQGTLSSRKDNIVRPFCKDHVHRGDCGMEDNDLNYERLALRINGAWVPYPGESE
jgi:hypothetical protein